MSKFQQHLNRLRKARDIANLEHGHCPNRSRCACGENFCHDRPEWVDTYHAARRFPASTDLLFDDSDPCRPVLESRTDPLAMAVKAAGLSAADLRVPFPVEVRPTPEPRRTVRARPAPKPRSRR